MCHIADTLADLLNWSQETGKPIPRQPYHIAYIENAGGIVDLDTGRYFTQAESWIDFGHRWLDYQDHIGRNGDGRTDRLANAILRASEHGYNYALCRQIAVTILRRITGE